MGITVLVCGGRDYADALRVEQKLDIIHREHGIGLMVHGACGWDADRSPFDEERLRGADRHAHFWAKTRCVAGKACPAHWSTHGKKAGRLRNARMLERHKPEMVVAFPGGHGTRNMVRLARRELAVLVDTVDWKD